MGELVNLGTRIEFLAWWECFHLLLRDFLITASRPFLQNAPLEKGGMHETVERDKEFIF